MEQGRLLDNNAVSVKKEQRNVTFVPYRVLKWRSAGLLLGLLYDVCYMQSFFNCGLLLSLKSWYNGANLCD